MLSLQIAFKFLTSSKIQMFLISLGIAIGVSVQVFIGSLIFGLQESLLDATVGSSPHITISANKPSEKISDYQTLEENLKNKETLKYVSIVYDNNAFIIDQETTYPVLVRGFNLNDADQIYDFSNKLIEGNLPINDEIIMGKDLAESLNVKINENIIIETPFGLNKEVKLVGIFDLQVAALNKTWLIANLETALDVFNEAEVITAIEIQIEDVFTARETADEIKTDLLVSNWKDANEQLLAGLNGQSVSSLMIQIFVMISVLLAIASVLIISVVQKRRQLGILKAMGITDQDAVKIFLLQGFLLGIIGATFGILLGFALIYLFTTFAVDADGTAIVSLILNYRFLVISWLIAILAATLAAIAPALSSKNLSPIEVIKNG